MTSILTNILAFIALISILVAVHEYGHFIVGRWSGMKVLRYSIGFGKPIWTHIGRKDKTEFCISAIPLGGYVRFLDSREGEVEPEDEGRAFDQRPIPARIAVLLAGPMFNFFLAIMMFWILTPAGNFEVSRPIIGDVTPNSYADRAGILHGDRIVAVGGTKVSDWEPALQALLTDIVDDGIVSLSLEGNDGRIRESILDVGEDKIKLTDPDESSSLFDSLGFQDWQAPAVVDNFGDGRTDSVASKAGMRIGDEIIAVNGAQINNFNDLLVNIQPLAGQEAKIDFLRAGEALSVVLVVGIHPNNSRRGFLGIGRKPNPERYVEIRRLTVLGSFNGAVAKTWDSTVFTVTMLGRMVTGDVSIKNISGPINIAQIAGESVDRGWRYAVYILAVISISLGVLNLLPIPVLDGGQIVYQLAEAIKGGPLSERTQMLGQQAGIIALLVLMSFAFYNDIARSFS